MRAALQDRPAIRFAIMAFVFGALTLTINAVLDSEVSGGTVVGSVIGGLVFATLMKVVSRHADWNV